MKILLIEDDKGKRSSIIEHLKHKGVPDDNILIAENMTDFSAMLHNEIGLFIIDFNIPTSDTSSPISLGREILETIIKAGKNNALMLAISSYPGEFPGFREYFEANGCILADYSNPEIWKSTLDHLLTQLNKTLNLDFLIFCALSEERRPYGAIFPGARTVTRGGLRCMDITIGGKRGSVILQPKMGLVNAAITAAVAIDRYNPKIVAMSGICGGFKDRAEMGQLLISSMAYEYQSGKWSVDGFRNEPYQVSLDNEFAIEIEELVESPGLLRELEADCEFDARPSKTTKPALAIFTSGSAVIADPKLISQIETYQRKVAGLDMEIYAIKQASELSTAKPVCLCAKTVVDLCDANKDDSIHLYGSYISAKFVVKGIERFFSCLRNDPV